MNYNLFYFNGKVNIKIFYSFAKTINIKYSNLMTKENVQSPPDIGQKTITRLKIDSLSFNRALSMVLVMQNQLDKDAKKQQISQEIPQQKQIKTSAYIPGQKNGKWSEEEHMRYVVFIDFYKEKMRSKEKRRYQCSYFRSNQFYKEMSDFICTRNGLQCRSHHQKLQEKYIYTNKIIAAFKQKFDSELYKQQFLSLKKCNYTKFAASQGKISEDSPSIQIKSTKDVEIQTDLQGIGLNYIMVDQNTIMICPPLQAISFETRPIFYSPNFIFPQN